jgi:iron(III) transport system permease protein
VNAGAWALLGLMVLLVLWPVALIILGSFQAGRPGQSAALTLDAWRVALSEPRMLDAVWNTITLTLARQLIAFPIAIALAWVLARTDMPGAQWLEFLFWIAFFLPSLPVTLGWILLLRPTDGLLNQLVVLLPFVEKGPFNIYSFWGIVWAHLASATIAVKVMLLTPAFRNMDASLEEASRVSGASTLGTLARVVVPVMTPVLVVVLLLSIIHSLQAFEIEMILGVPFRFYVFSTQIYTLLRQDPPLFAEATALSSIILGCMLPFIVMQRWAIERRSFVTVSSHFRGHKIRLRRWRLPVFLLVLGVALLVTVVPFVFLVVATLMKLFGFFNIPEPWTTEHWSRVFGEQIFLNSVRNTLLLAAGTALAGVAFYTIAGYVAVRSRFRGRAAVDLLSWLPSTLPGIILGLGLLSLFLGSPLLRPLYGSILLMVIATIVSSLPLGVQLIKSTFVQLGPELEEAAQVGGGNWWQGFRHVLLPLIMPTLLLVGAVSFIAAARNVSTIALLASGATRPLSLLQLDFMIESRYEAAAVVGVLVVLMTAGVALLARLFGLRGGLTS